MTFSIRKKRIPTSSSYTTKPTRSTEEVTTVQRSLVTVVIPGYAYWMKSCLSHKECFLVSKDIFDIHKSRGTKLNFEDGFQTTNRSRMLVALEDWPNSKVLLDRLNFHSKSILNRNWHKGVIKFNPNVAMVTLVFPGGSLKQHWNDRNTDSNDIVAVLSIGCTINYKLIAPEISSAALTNNDGIEKFDSNFKVLSGDMLVFDGHKVKHGYKKLNTESFSNALRSDVVNGAYRLGISLFQLKNPREDFSNYFWNGEAQDKPKYKEFPNKSFNSVV